MKLALWLAFSLSASAAQIVFDGTSLISGFTLGVSNSISAHIARTLPESYAVKNIAVSGQTGGAMLADFESQVAPLAETSDAIVFDMGTNDLAVEGADVETVKGRYAEYVARCFSAGFKWVFIRPLSPRAADVKAFTEANRLALNEWLVATYPTNVWGGEPRVYGPWGGFTRYWIDDLGPHWGSEWFLDSVHLNKAGIVLDAAALRRKMVDVGFLTESPAALSAKTFHGLSISGTVGSRYKIEASDNGEDWAEVASIQLVRPSQNWVDESDGPMKFYRAVLIPH